MSLRRVVDTCCALYKSKKTKRSKLSLEEVEREKKEKVGVLVVVV